MDTEERAVIEMEAPPEPPRRRWPVEAILGLALVVGVLGLAGIDWWRTEQAAQAYRQGQAAATLRHWDAAAQAFAQAGEYADAARQRATAVGQATRRDALLAQATQASSPGRTWQALQAAAAIEPDYPGLAERVQGARQQLFQQGVAGAIFLQAGGAQPGLYLLTGQGPARLPGSDAQSRVRGSTRDGQAFVYDRAPASDSCLLPCAPGLRQVALVRLAPPGPPVIQFVGGDLDPNGSATWAGDPTRFWWTAGGRAWYCDLAGRQITDILQTHPGWRLLALDPAQGQILLAAPLDDGWAGTESTPLYLAQADGQRVQPLQPALGRVINARFSAGGAYLVYLTQQAAGQTVRTLWRVDLQHPDTSLEGFEWLSWDDVQTQVWLGAFLPPAPAGEVVLVYRLDAHGEEITQVNLRTGGRTLLWSGPGRTLHANTAAISPDGRTLAIHNAQGVNSTLSLLDMTGAGPARAFPAPIFGSQSVQTAFSPGGDYVVYTVHNPEGIDRGYTQPIYTLPSQAPAGTPPLAVTWQAVRPYDPGLLTIAFPPGGDLLLYVSAGGDLQATTFDGAARATLASGVDAVWSLRDPAPWTWVR